MIVERVSPLVDSCAGMVQKKAHRTYYRIPSDDKRWIDLDDVIQDGFIEAWKAEQRYDPTNNTKYSTYLFRGLDLMYAGSYSTPLRQKKRRAAGLLEIDAPVSDGVRSLDFADGAPDVQTVLEAAASLTAVFASADDATKALLLEWASPDFDLRRLLKRARGIGTDDAVAKIAPVFRRLCHFHHVTERDFRLFLSHNVVKAKVLEAMSQVAAVSVEVSTARVLECGICRDLFSLSDVRERRYMASSLACDKCLTKMQGEAAQISCFGKKVVINEKRALGFSEENAACRLHCMDRKACKHYGERGKTMAEAAVLDDTLNDVDFEDEAVASEDETADSEVETTTPKAGKAKNKAKAKTTAKAKSGKKAKVHATAKEKAVKAKSKETVAKAKPKVKEAVKAKAAAAEKPERKARKPKSTKPLDLKSPLAKELIKKNLDEKGRDLPFKEKSMLRYLITACVKPGGASKADLAKDIKKGGFKESFQFGVLAQGESGGKKRPYPSTHTWKFEEKNGRLHVSNVKRIAVYEKIPRTDGFPKKK